MKLSGNNVLYGFILLSFIIFGWHLKKIEAQTNCAVINNVKINATTVASNQPFVCEAQVDSSHAGSPSIACGISFNGEWPTNLCPSDVAFGGWQGSTARFNCVFPNTNIPESIQKVEVVAFDFRPECGMQTGKSVMININRNTQQPTTNPRDQERGVKEFFSGLFSLGRTTPSPAQTQPTQVPNIGEMLTPTPQSPPTQEINSIEQLLGNSSQPYSGQVVTLVQGCIKNRSVYEQASNYTGVPWQVLAGIHYREGDCGENNSLVSGRRIGNNEPDIRGNCSSQRSGLGIPKPLPGGGCGFDSLLSSAVYAGNHLKGKIGRNPQSYADLLKALSRYNGGGNSNCGKTPYANCPRTTEGEDDTYVMNFFDQKHTPMYIVYCADYTLCNPPRKDTRPGTATAARIVAGLTTQ